MFWSGMNTSAEGTFFYIWYQITIFSAYGERLYYGATMVIRGMLIYPDVPQVLIDDHLQYRGIGGYIRCMVVQVAQMECAWTLNKNTKAACVSNHIDWNLNQKVLCQYLCVKEEEKEAIDTMHTISSYLWVRNVCSCVLLMLMLICRV
jgi:hypothetical protein